MIIRIAERDDAAAMLAIYAPYIANTSFTFETAIPSIGEFENRTMTTLEGWPWLVCEINGVIAGYAYATRHRERTAYQWCTECSIYLHDDFMNRGIGSLLYKALFRILEKQGFRNVYAVINLPNDNSVRLHEKCGFHHFASFEKVGYKLGKWKTVGWWKLAMNKYDSEPAAPVLFKQLDKKSIDKILHSINEEKSK